MEIIKTSLCGPIIAIETVQITSSDHNGIQCDSTVLVYAQGGSVSIFTCDGGQLLYTFEPFPDCIRGTHNVSGLTVLSNQNLAIYGGKRVCIAHIALNSSPTFLLQLGPLADLVLDVQEVIHENFHHILVGFAQNYVEIYNIVDGILQASYRSCIVCVLFSMTVLTSGSDLLIASGTAFGKIILWSASIYPRGLVEYEPNSTLEGHTGVIFRMKIQVAIEKRLLASVSDDRSVRVWDITSLSTPTCLFIGWGHICRVWDVLFLEHGLVTCSEDATIKFWEFDYSNAHQRSGKCIATLAGHGKNIWRLTLLEADRSKIVISAGNDGAIKFWPIESHCVLSQKQEPSLETLSLLQSSRSYKIESPIPEALQPIPLSSHGNRRMNCAAGISVSPDGGLSVIVLLDGTTWIADMEYESIQWHYVHLESLHQQMSQSGITGVSVSWGEMIAISMIRSNGVVQFCLLKYSPQSSIANIDVVSSLSWEAHNGKGINTWILRQSHPQDFFWGYDVMTCSVEGLCAVFKVAVCSSSSSSPSNLQSVIPVINSCETFNFSLHIAETNHFSTTSQAIATAASIVTHHSNHFIVIGDCRGNLSLFDLNNFERWEESGRRLCYLKAHGLEVVSHIHDLQIQNIEDVPGFCSLGHDGYLNIYAIEESNKMPQVRIISRLSCLPITAPDQIFIGGQGLECSVYIGGFQASDYIIWDIRRKYQLLRTEAGSWKRPHHAVIQGAEDTQFPTVSFAVLSPSDKNTKLTCLRYDSSKSSPIAKNTPLHLGLPGNGKVSYAAAFIPCGVGCNPLVVVGGEDGSVKLYDRWDGSLHFLQEVQMPMNAAVKAISHTASLNNSPSRIQGIVVAAGGKLSYSIWSYDIQLPKLKGIAKWPLLCILHPLCSSMMRTPTRKRNNSKRKAKEGKNQRKKVSAGGTTDSEDLIEETEEVAKNQPISKVSTSDDQEHRILCVSSSTTWYDASLSSGNYIVLLGDSKGLATLLLINSNQIAERTYERSTSPNYSQEEAAPVGAVVIEEFFPSEYPLLANDILCVPVNITSSSLVAGSLQFAIFGDTTGEVSLWCLKSSSILGRYVVSVS